MAVVSRYWHYFRYILSIGAKDRGVSQDPTNRLLVSPAFRPQSLAATLLTVWALDRRA
jgi:hypothetical protein